MSDKITRVKERLELYYEAEKAVLLRQSYRIGSRELTMANLDTIRKQIDTLESEVTALEKNGGKRCVKRVIPLDI